MTARPSGTVTFLFTDIEGSTRLLQRLGDGYKRLLEDHHAIVRAVLAERGGSEISTEGDAFFVAFEGAPAAVSAAAEIQRRLATHAWPDGEQVRVRMGLHTGEASIVGDNYGGIDVHRAARVAAAGHGGQVLISAATEALVRDALPEGVSLRDLGEHRLKDLEHPEHISQLCIRGLDSDFAPIRSLGAAPTNLPTQLTTFVGRQKVVDAVRSLLAVHRLVTLTGPGGTGKTRLGIQVAHVMVADFPDGVFFVPLASVEDPSMVPSTIAQALRIREERDEPILATLKDHLAAKKMLVVLDNFEHLVDAAWVVPELLQAAPQIRLLVTSRGALHISAEQEFEVQPLEAPTGDSEASLDELGVYEAIALFCQRAAAVKADFVLDADNAPAIARIVAAVEGLPLAIELAAARIRLLSPEQIADRLGRSLSLLTGGAQDVPARQRTLRGAIDWSHDLLDERERRLFARLAVFAGGWTLDAADAVCNPAGELGIDTLDGLESLLDKGLIRRDALQQASARFRLLQIIREYALEKLEGSADAPVVRLRHAEFFVDLAEAAETELTGPKQAELLATLDSDQDNIRATLSHALTGGAHELGLRLAGAIWRFWYLRAHLAEGREWLSQLLQKPGSDGSSVGHARATAALGSIAYWQNDFAVARRSYERSLEVYEELRHTRGRAEQHYNLGYIATIEGDPETARTHFSAAASLSTEAGDRKSYAYARMGVGMAATFSEDLVEAEAAGHESLAIFEELGEWFGGDMARFVLYRVMRKRDDLVGARKILGDMLPTAQESGDVLSLAAWLQYLGDIFLKLGDPASGVVLDAAGQSIRDSAGGGAPLPLMDLPENTLEAASKELGEDAARALWNEGYALSSDEAVARAKALVENGP